MCQAKGDDNSAGPYGTVQLRLHRRKCLVLRSAQKGLLTCVFSRKEKQRNLGQLSEVTLTQKTATLVSLPVSQLQSVLDGCAGSAVPAAALPMCFLKSSRSVFSTFHHISPLLLMILVWTRKQCWSWMQERWLLLEAIYDHNKEIFFPFFFN